MNRAKYVWSAHVLWREGVDARVVFNITAVVMKTSLFQERGVALHKGMTSTFSMAPISEVKRFQVMLVYRSTYVPTRTLYGSNVFGKSFHAL